MPPRTVDNYEILDELGQGGMAVVYRARDVRLRREVALKILHEHIAQRPENRVRFEREATAAARLRHPNIVQVYGCSAPDAEVGWLATELIDGPTLRGFVEDTGFTLPQVAAMVARVLADALEHAHTNGVIHRDVKPENIMIDGSGAPKLMDFGLARVLDDQRLTMTGSLLGSPAHMSPEMIEGEPLAATSDVFALGTVLYFMATGALPFDGSNPAVVLNAILRGEYPPPGARNPAIDAPLEAIIDRCLARQVEARYPTAQAVREALDGYLGELGIGDANRELGTFFGGPAAYCEQLRDRLVERLESLGRSAAAEGRTAALLRTCDRLLALDPGNRPAREWLATVEAGRRRKRIGGLVAGLAGALGLSVLLLLLPSPPTATTPQAEPDGALPPVAEDTADDDRADEPETLASAAQAALTRVNRGIRDGRVALAVPPAVARVEAATGHADEEARREARSRPRVQPVPTRPVRLPPPQREVSAPPDEEDVAVAPEPPPPPPPPPPPGELSLRVWPLTAVILVNGTSIGTAQSLTGPLELPPGRHEILARLPELGTQVSQRVTVQSGRRTEVALVVPWRPAHILVESSATATVFIDGRRAGRSREAIEVAIEGRRPQRTVLVEVYPDGRFGQPWEARITLRTGEERRLEVPF